MAGTPESYIGCKIDVISNADIRYEGTLMSLSQKDSTVSLQNVRSHGTEGRVRRPGGVIPPQDQVYEYIIFHGKDIKDIVVYESPVLSGLRNSVSNDSAIIEAGIKDDSSFGGNTSGWGQGMGKVFPSTGPRTGAMSYNGGRGGMNGGGRGGMYGGSRGGMNGGGRGGRSLFNGRTNWNQNQSQRGYTGGQGFRNGGQGYRTAGQGIRISGSQFPYWGTQLLGQPGFNLEEARHGDFDVEKYNEKFQEVETKGGAGESSSSFSTGRPKDSLNEREVKPYNPTSALDGFFDEISCDANEKDDNARKTRAMHELQTKVETMRMTEQQHNSETFGIPMRYGGGQGGVRRYGQSNGGRNPFSWLGGGNGNLGGNVSRNGNGSNMGRQQPQRQNTGGNRGNGRNAGGNNGGRNTSARNGSAQQTQKQVTLYLQADGKTYGPRQPVAGNGRRRRGQQN